MPRILFFVFLAFLFWLAIRVLGGSRKRDDSTKQTPPSEPKAVEAITQCAWCGVHVPSREVVSLPDGRVYCSTVHRDAALAAVTHDERGRS